MIPAEKLLNAYANGIFPMADSRHAPRQSGTRPVCGESYRLMISIFLQTSSALSVTTITT